MKTTVSQNEWRNISPILDFPQILPDSWNPVSRSGWFTGFRNLDAIIFPNVFVKKHGPIFLNSLFFYIKSVHYFLLFSKFNFSKFRNMYCFFKIFTICFILNLLILQTCLHFVFLLVKMQKNIYILFYFSYTHNAYTYALCRLDWLYLKFKSLRKFEFEVTMFEQYSWGLSVLCSTTT